jgi:hypothetical protein
MNLFLRNTFRRLQKTGYTGKISTEDLIKALPYRLELPTMYGKTWCTFKLCKWENIEKQTMYEIGYDSCDSYCITKHVTSTNLFKALVSLYCQLTKEGYIE